MIKIVLIAIFCLPIKLFASTDLLELGKQYEKITIRAYEANAKNIPATSSDLVELYDQVKEAMAKQDVTTALTLTFSQWSKLTSNPDNRVTLYFLQLLLQQYYLERATELYTLLQQQDRYIAANAHFLMAKQAFAAENWQTTIDLLEKSIFSLEPKQVQHANLLYGIALQKLKRHRDALTYYKEITPDSPFYAHAQLNIATVYIRQGWWTDAYQIMQDLLDAEDITLNNEVENRLYLVIGYAFLEQEYYRDARNIFGKISLESQYTPLALMGIALTASYQKDYVGALNILIELKEQPVKTLPVYEANLVYPYVLLRLQQPLAAETNYREAVDFYRENIQQLQQNIAQIDTIQDSTGIVTLLQKNTLDTSAITQVLTIEQSLANLAKIAAAAEQPAIRQLQQKYQNYLQEYAVTALGTRIEQLQSYLSQAEYGLVRMYDADT